MEWRGGLLILASVRKDILSLQVSLHLGQKSAYIERNPSHSRKELDPFQRNGL